jgi:hypothetical protein
MNILKYMPCARKLHLALKVSKSKLITCELVVLTAAS